MNHDKLLLSTLSQDAFYQVNKSLVSNIGIVPAMVLSYLIDKKKYFALVNQLDNEGGFFLSAKKIREKENKENINAVEYELGIGEVARRSSYRVLEKKNLLRIAKKGHPARHYYYLNSENILNLISSSPTQSHATSYTDTNATSPTQSHATYNKNKEQQQTIKTLTLSEQLKELAIKNNLTYSANPDEQGLFLNKLMRLNYTNERILEQANRFFEIVKRDPKLNWIHAYSFGFKFLQFNWDKIEAWHNANKSQVVQFKKPENQKPKEKPSFSVNDLDSLKEFLA